MRSKVAKDLVVVAAVLLLVSPAPAQTRKTVAIRAGTLLDPVGGRALAGETILISDGAVQAVGPGLAVPRDASVIDLSQATVLPGLIDCHVHITGQMEGNYYDKSMTRASDS